MTAACVTPSAYPPAAPLCRPPVTYQPPATTTTSTGTPATPTHLASTGSGDVQAVITFAVILLLVGAALAWHGRKGRLP